MYLLNLPNREKKVKVVKRRENKNKVPTCRNVEDNEKVLSSLRTLK